MACFEPTLAWYDEDDLVTFNPNQARAIEPIAKLPCGKCLGCRKRHQSDWAIRCYHESLMHSRNSFLTLTYSDDQLDNQSVDVRPAQLFLKRLRRRFPDVRFFHVAEYGDTTKRPHHHMLLFNEDFSADRKVRSKTGDNVTYNSQTLDECWQHGFATIQDLNPATALYTAKYTHKIAADQTTKDEYLERFDILTGEVFHVAPEFATMSRRPGLGTRFFHTFWRDIYPHDFVVFDGIKYRPPKFYDNLLAQTQPDVWAEVQINREHHKEDPLTKKKREPQVLQATKANAIAKHHLYNQSKL